MVNKTDNATTNKYIQARFAKMDDVKRGEARTIKKGDSLWNIAKEKTGSKSAGEISNYVLSIAKVNGFDTVEKMNNIKVNTVIYLPQGASKPKQTKPAAAKTQQKTPSQKTVTQPAQKPQQTQRTVQPQQTQKSQNTQKTQSAQNAQKTAQVSTKTQVQPAATKPTAKTPSEEFINQAVDIVLHDKSAYVQRATGLKNEFHVYRTVYESSNIGFACDYVMKTPSRQTVMTYKVGPDNKIVNYSFYDFRNKGGNKRYDVSGNTIKLFDRLKPEEDYQKIGEKKNTNLSQINDILVRKANETYFGSIKVFLNQ